MKISIRKFLSLFLFSFFGLISALNAQTMFPNGAFTMHGAIGQNVSEQKVPNLKVWQVPLSQIKNECTFFGADSLNGFDVMNEATKMGANSMYKEFQVYIFMKETEFVKKKYNIAQLPFEVKKNAQKKSPPVINSACTNLDIEDGNFTNWTGDYGYNSNSTTPFTITGSGGSYGVNGDRFDCNYWELLTSAYGNDYYGNFPGVSPQGGSYAARVGGEAINERWNYGFYHWCTNAGMSSSSSSAEDLYQTFVVTSANALITYQYAVILNDGGGSSTPHPAGAQPYFRAEIDDLAGNPLSVCTKYEQEIVSGVTPPGYTLSSNWNDEDGTNVYYLPWTYNSVNLTPYIGSTVTLKFTAAGCIYGGHFGYAYVDATCGSVNITITPISPCAGSTGVLTAPPVAGGSYVWSGPVGGIIGSNTGQSVTVGTSGTYFVTVTPSQGAGCAYTLSATVSFDSPVGSLSSQTNVNCFGNSTGSATVSASGGAPAYTYAWSPSGGNAATANNLAAGTYNCTVYDSYGCSSVTSVTITQPSALNASISSQTNVSCNGGNNGSATVSPSGGTPNYTYSWSPSGGNAATANNLSAGTYNCTVTDANGCPKVVSVTITQPSVLNASVSSQTNVLCNGGNSGSATVSPSGGTPNYTYAWTPSGGNAATANNLTAGNYTCTVTDNHGCTKTVAVTITQPSALAAIISSSTNVNCNGGNNGSATANPSGGTPAYTYAWSPSGGNGQTANNLTAGNYTVTVTDNHGCTKTATVAITQPAALSNSVTATSILCHNQTNGSATANPSGGTPAYTYAWSPSGGNAATASNLSAGNYTVTVTDNHGCTNTATVAITQPPILDATGSSVNVSCFGGNNGSATINPSGGTPAYTYVWTPSGGNSNTASNLTAGNYTVVATDSHGCTLTGTFSITQPTAMTTSVSSTNAGCSVSNGSATVNTSGGNPAYTYSWNPSGQTTQTATGLGAGNYVVTIHDANGCTKTASVTITATGAPSIQSTASTPAGCSVSNGSATATATGGTPNYTYSWSNGQTTQTATGLSNGSYNITITDANGCSVTTAVSVTVTAAPTASVNVTQAGCSVANGSATANPSGGTPNYSYSWSNGQTTQTATGLSGGNYTVTVTDANGCSTTSTTSITATAAPTISSMNSSAAGCSVANGNATVTPTGGTPNYTYNWSNGQSTQTATGLAGGNYSVVVTDANGCTATSTVNVGSTSAPTATASATQATCNTANGSGTATPTGGTPGYSYNWSNGQTTQTATGFSPGNYSVVITDANGCTTSTSVSITAANGPTVTVSASNTVACNGGNNGSASAVITGGTPQYTYNWSNGQTTSIATGLSSGTYTLTVLDSNNCSFVSTINISQPAILTTSLTAASALCNGGNSGSATINPSGGTPGYTYSWSNGQTNATATGLVAGNYSVMITDANGCTATNTVNVSQPSALSTFVSATTILCNGGTASATASSSGGTPNYSYAWSNGQTNATATNLLAGNYSVVITDANGCTSTNTLSITQPAALSTSVSATTILCNGGTATANASAAGGTGNFTYIWSNLQTGSTATNLSAGNYSVTITDGNGCTAVNSVTISQPSLLSVSASGTNILCNGGKNGAASVSVSGGTPNYTYAWSNGQTGVAAINLSAGNYSVLITDANGCTSTATATVTEPAPLTLATSGNDSVCAGDSASVSAAAAGGNPAYTYLWMPGFLTGPSIQINPTSNTTYTVTVTDANGCTTAGAATTNIVVFPAPKAYFDTASSSMYSSTFAFTDSSTGGSSWYWLFGDGTNSTQQNPVHTYTAAGTYTATEVVFNQFGCPDTFIRVITFNDGILIPNVFTPDGDGVNDVWYIPNSGVKGFHVIIYNRWGEKVFETTADEIRWDGRSNSGELLSDGTYYFALTAYLKSVTGDKNYSTNGYVTLITHRPQ